MPILRLWFCALEPSHLVDTDMSSILRHFKDKLLRLMFNHMRCKFELVSTSSFRKVEHWKETLSLFTPHSFMKLSFPYTIPSFPPLFPFYQKEWPSIAPSVRAYLFLRPPPSQPPPPSRSHNGPLSRAGPFMNLAIFLFFFFLQSPKWIG